MNTQRRILIIDDDPHVLEVIRLFSEIFGYAGDTVLTGNEAIKMIIPGRHWAIFCDLKMPGINGIEVFENVLKIDKDLSKRFVIISGAIFETDMITEKGVMFLRKPFLFEEIRNTFKILEECT